MAETRASIVVVAAEAIPARLGKQERGSHPAQAMIGTLPALYLPADPFRHRETGLDAIGAGNGSTQLVADAKFEYRERFFHALHEAGRRARIDRQQFVVQLPQSLFSISGFRHFVGTPQFVFHGALLGVGNMLADIADFMHLAALNKGGVTSMIENRAPNRLAAIDDVQAWL